MRSALNTLTLVASLGVPTVAIGLLSPGPFSSRILQGGILMLALGGAGAGYLLWRGIEADRAQDEREERIVERTTKTSFFVTAVAVQTYWAWQFSMRGNAGDTSFYVFVVMWASFVLSYAYHKLRT